jgi:multisubunit Na+/H+ antiporter MnhB subunit
MKSLILERATRILFVGLQLLAFFIFMRGHQAAGGGFIAGLVSSIAFVLAVFSFGVKSVKKYFAISPQILCSVGLLFSFLAVVLSSFFHKSMMTGLWFEFAGMDWGTPQLFDLGVFFIVVGAVEIFIFHWLKEEMD